MIGGTLSNSNFVQVGNNGPATTVTAGGLSNTGRIDVDGGNTNQAVLDVISASAPSTWSGTVNVNNDGLLEFAGTGGISTIAAGAQINLFGADALVAAAGLGTTSNTALTGLSSILGQLSLQDGATLSTTGDLSNGGNLLVNAGGTGGSTLMIGGTLSNSNFVQVGNNGPATTVTAGGLSNTGRIDVDGGNTNQASLNVTGAAVNTGTININGFADLDISGALTGSGTVNIGANAQLAVAGASGGTLTFTGGNATLSLDGRASFSDTIAGMTLGDSIHLNNTNATSASLNGQILTVALAGGGALTYALTGNFAGESFVTTHVGSASYVTLVAGADEPPVTTVPAGETIPSGVVTAISGVSVTDAQAVNLDETITTTLSDSSGQLYAYTGVTSGGGVVAGSGTNRLSVTGSVAQVNADLSTLTMLESIAGSDTIDVTTTDELGGSDNHQIPVTITGAGNAPLPIASGKTLELATSAQNVIFVGAGGILKLDNPEGFTGEIDGLGLGDVIDFASATVASASISGSTLTVTDGGQKLNYTMSGALSGNYFAITSDGHGGSDLTLSTIVSTAAQYYGDFRSATAALNAIIADGAGPAQTSAGMINLYNETIADAAQVIGSGGIQNYQSVVAAANALLADVPNSFDPTRIGDDERSLFQAVIADTIATIYGETAEQTYTQTLQEQTKVFIDLGSNAPLAQYKADESTLANNSVAGVMAALGGPAMQQAYGAALQTYDTLKADTYGAPTVSGAQILSDAAAADAPILTVIGLIDSDAAQADFGPALVSDAQTLDQFWNTSESAGENYFSGLSGSNHCGPNCVPATLQSICRRFAGQQRRRNSTRRRRRETDDTRAGRSRPAHRGLLCRGRGRSCGRHGCSSLRLGPCRADQRAAPRGRSSCRSARRRHV